MRRLTKVIRETESSTSWYKMQSMHGPSPSTGTPVDRSSARQRRAATFSRAGEAFPRLSAPLARVSPTPALLFNNAPLPSPSSPTNSSFLRHTRGRDLQGLPDFL